MALLEACGLVKFYGRRCVVDGVNFDVEAGEVVGLLGPNGAGKTTSFKMTTGFTAPNDGKVLFNGEEVTHLPMYLRARLGMGYLCQEKSVFRRLTVEQNILAILEMLPRARSLNRALTRTERWERTDKVLDQFGLNHVRKNSAARLSGGETRRLEIARCLVCEPLLILMDEPFTGIDPKTIGDIQQIVLALRNQGIGILLTDHNVREALKITTRSYLIKDGKVRTHGTPWQIVNDPIAISEYLGSGFNDDSFTRPPEERNQPRPEPARGNVLSMAKLPPLEEPGLPPSQKPTVEASPRRLSQVEAAKTEPSPAPQPQAPRKPAAETLTRRVSPETVRMQPAPSVPRPEAAQDQQESLQSLVEKLKSNPDQAAATLIKRGVGAVPVLLAALERRDVELRRLVKEVLQKILQRPIVFDPFAPEAARMQQIAALRDHVGRKAG